MGVDWCLPLMRYGDVSKVHRRLFHQFLNTDETEKLENFQYLCIHEFLYRLVESPKDFFGHTNLCVALRLVRDRRFDVHCSPQFSLTGSLMLMIMYGIRSKSEKDTHFVMTQRAAAAVGRALVPGAFLVDTFPICKCIWPGPRAIRVQSPRSETCSRVVSWSWLPQICQGLQERLG